MSNAFGYDKPLSRRQLNDSIFEINQELAFDNIKKFVDVRVRMPMIFTFDDAEPDNRVVNLGQGLVPPFVGAGIDELLHIHDLQRFMQDVEVRLGRELLRA